MQINCIALLNHVHHFSLSAKWHCNRTFSSHYIRHCRLAVLGHKYCHIPEVTNQFLDPDIWNLQQQCEGGALGNTAWGLSSFKFFKFQTALPQNSKSCLKVGREITYLCFSRYDGALFWLCCCLTVSLGPSTCWSVLSPVCQWWTCCSVKIVRLSCLSEYLWWIMVLHLHGLGSCKMHCPVCFSGWQFSKWFAALKLSPTQREERQKSLIPDEAKTAVEVRCCQGTLPITSGVLSYTRLWHKVERPAQRF